MKVAVIPARGGSKRIPGKNIKEFYGKPMIAWSIEAALATDLFDKVIVSTDDHIIASIATQYGAEIPFTRPANLSDDYATTVEVMAHATNWLIEQFSTIHSICCIYPTAPFLDSNDLVTGLEVLTNDDWRYSFSVTTFNTSIYRSFLQSHDGGVEMLFPQHYNTRSQDLPECLRDAAQFYWGTKDAWLSNSPIFEKYSTPVFIPEWRVIDIDNSDDFDRAEVIAPYVYKRMRS